MLVIDKRSIILTFEATGASLRDKASVDSSRKSGSTGGAACHRNIQGTALSLSHTHRKRQIFEKEIPRKGLWGVTLFLTCHLARHKSFTPSGILLSRYFAFSFTVHTELTQRWSQNSPFAQQTRIPILFHTTHLRLNTALPTDHEA